jgi:hypothetical protein
MDAEHLCQMVAELRRRAAVLARMSEQMPAPNERIRLMCKAAEALCSADALDKRLRVKISWSE